MRFRAYYYSIMLDAHPVTSMADTDVDAVKKRKNAESIKQYRLKRKLLLQASTSTRTELAEKQKKAEYDKQYGMRCKFLMQQQACNTFKNITDTHNKNTCDKYKSSLIHIHDPVLSSLNMKGICLLSLYSVELFTEIYSGIAIEILLVFLCYYIRRSLMICTTLPILFG
jgi:hypothetical protein